MNELKVFENERFGQVRMVMHEGKPYAVGVDIARALEYANPSKAVINHCKGISKLGIPSYNQHGAEVVQETNCIPEGDMFRLIVKAADQSRSPVVRGRAEQFEKWLFDEVLPSIRQHGAYLTPEAADTFLRDPDTLYSIVSRWKIDRQRLSLVEAKSAQQEQIIAELQPKASYYDLILQNKSLVPVSMIAKDYGLSARAFNLLLNELGIQYRLSDSWLLYQRYADQGYTQSRTHILNAEKSVMHTYWTQKGRLFLYEMLKREKNLLPIIEREVGEGHARLP